MKLNFKIKNLKKTDQRIESLTTTAKSEDGDTPVQCQCTVCQEVTIIAILDAHSAARGKNIIAVPGAFSVKCGKCRQANLFLHIKTLART